MKKAMWVLSLSLCFSLYGSPWANAQDGGRSWHDLVRKSLTSLSGLEASEYKGIKVAVNFKGTGSPFGESFQERVRAECELRLRQAGLEPVAEKISGEYLRVNCSILARTMAIDLNFMRLAAFSAEEKIYMAEASTWETGTFGTHGKKEETVLSSLGGRLDLFVKEYLKANSRPQK